MSEPKRVSVWPQRPRNHPARCGLGNSLPPVQKSPMSCHLSGAVMGHIYRSHQRQRPTLYIFKHAPSHILPMPFGLVIGLGEILPRSGDNLLTEQVDAGRQSCELSNLLAVSPIPTTQLLGPRSRECLHSRHVGTADPKVVWASRRGTYEICAT